MKQFIWPCIAKDISERGDSRKYLHFNWTFVSLYKEMPNIKRKSQVFQQINKFDQVDNIKTLQAQKQGKISTHLMDKSWILIAIWVCLRYRYHITSREETDFWICFDRSALISVFGNDFLIVNIDNFFQKQNLETLILVCLHLSSLHSVRCTQSSMPACLLWVTEKVRESWSDLKSLKPK